MSHLCNVNFISQYCFINGTQINIQEYITNKNNQKITCQKGHELILANGEKRKAYFRHKNSDDIGGNPMTLWHIEWQSYFPITEVCFQCKPNQIKERRADVLLNEKKTLEIQHSKYEKEEIDNRKYDYSLHGIEIIWLIDGNKNIDVKKLEYANRVYLEFTSDYWKYESFKSYDNIFIDINSIIYKVNPNKVKSHMIDVENGKTKEEFIESLKKDINIWKNEEPEQCNLFIKQQGAGNGKTFGIIKMLEDDDNSHYTNFIYITKQHSAKHIIKKEFESQKNNFQYLKNIEITENNKKYIIKYFNEKSKKNCQIIVATIDSFTNSIGNKNHTHFDKFEGLIYSIIDGHIETKNCGAISFGGISPKLNKETKLVIDEFQDPPEHYAKAIVQIMRNKYIDVFIVGDKLQSISNEKNAFTYFLENEFPLINIIKLEPTNICRRFIHPKLVDFVNFMIPFEKYELPEIKPYEEYIGEEYNPLVFFTSKQFIDSTNNTSVNEDKIFEEIEKIMNYYENEVNENKRLPEDFLIVTPFTKNNPLVDALLLAINIFWKNKFTNNIEYLKEWKNNMTIDDYYRYAIFHKSEEGSSIDLSESEYSTRIVSCHASKGDGRKVVFIIGFNESALKKFSQTSNNLVYNSLLHVGITRMKEKLYIRYENNNDDISRKINEYRKSDRICEEMKPNININNYIKYNEITSNSINESYKLFFENIITPTDLEPIIENKDEKRIVDMGNHIIRYSALYINILLEIVNKEKTNKDSEIKKQIIAILNTVCESDITPVNDMKGYYTLLRDDCEKEIPIIKISNKGSDYIKYFNAIIELTNHLKIKIKNLLKNNEELILCPLECVILNYMIQIVNEKKKSSINIVDIYDIFDLYNNSFDNDNINGHDNCLCRKHFNKVQTVAVKNKKIDNIQFYLLKHFEKINDIKNIMSSFHKKYPQINWLMNQTIHYEGNDNFIIGKKFNLIGYDENIVIIAYIKPQFNSLNYNEILVNSIFETYLINNVKKYNDKGKISENYNRFNGKKVITCVFTLDRNTPYYIDWQDSIKNNFQLIKDRICFNIIEKYKLETPNLYYFYNYWRMFCPYNEKKSSDFIRFLKEKLEKIKKQMLFGTVPKYIDEFISQIEFEIELTKGKTNKELILKNYDDNNYFSEKIEKKLEINVKRYLAIKIDDDSDDDE
jgi:competence CoiA-like predicted nuclease